MHNLSVKGHCIEGWYFHQPRVFENVLRAHDTLDIVSWIQEGEPIEGQETFK